MWVHMYMWVVVSVRLGGGASCQLGIVVVIL